MIAIMTALKSDRLFFDNNKQLPMMWFHTKNIVGLQNMKCYYNNAISYVLEINSITPQPNNLIIY